MNTQHKACITLTYGSCNYPDIIYVHQMVVMTLFWKFHENRIKTEATTTTSFSMDQQMDGLTDWQKPFISPVSLQCGWEGDMSGAVTAVPLLKEKNVHNIYCVQKQIGLLFIHNVPKSMG